MATRRWKITNRTQGTVELGSKLGAIGVGEVVFVQHELSDHIKFLWGAKKLSIVEVVYQSNAPSTETPRVEASESMPQRNKKNRS